VGDEEKKKEAFEWSSLVGLVPVFITITAIGGFAWEECGHHVYGTTPAQIAALSLEGSPKQVAKGLSMTDVDSDRVRAKFKSSAGKPYEEFELTWKSKSASGPSEMRLLSEHSSKEDDEHGVEMARALAKRFHALHDGGWSWGAVTISVQSHGELEASVDPMPRDKPNPLFERQMDAARQVLLEAAFGIPVHASDADLAELLGTGYKLADVGKIDPRTMIEDAPALIASRFPGSLHDSSDDWEIAVDHPLLKSVRLHWSNRRGGRLNDMSVDASDAYAGSRDTFQACLANALGPPQVHVTDYAADHKDYVFTFSNINIVLERSGIHIGVSGAFEGETLAKLTAAFDGCREKSENTASRGDGRKK
jgi:hypothetical protein